MKTRITHKQGQRINYFFFIIIIITKGRRTRTRNKRVDGLAVPQFDFNESQARVMMSYFLTRYEFPHNGLENSVHTLCIIKYQLKERNRL